MARCQERSSTAHQTVSIITTRTGTDICLKANPRKVRRQDAAGHRVASCQDPTDEIRGPATPRVSPILIGSFLLHFCFLQDFPDSAEAFELGLGQFVAAVNTVVLQASGKPVVAFWAVASRKATGADERAHAGPTSTHQPRRQTGEDYEQDQDYHRQMHEAVRRWSVSGLRYSTLRERTL